MRANPAIEEHVSNLQHFFSTINFGKSCLDSQAIQFMNSGVMGRFINLEDILLAINKAIGHIGWVHMRSDGVIGVLESGDEFHRFQKEFKWKPGVRLRDQDQATTDFIYDSLKDPSK